MDSLTLPSPVTPNFFMNEQSNCTGQYISKPNVFKKDGNMFNRISLNFQTTKTAISKTNFENIRNDSEHFEYIQNIPKLNLKMPDVLKYFH